MKIEYKIKEVKPRVFAVIIKDDYDRAMTFCRVQEYYESPSEKFRGQNYSIWDFIKDYSHINGSFSYPQDWGGFNIPLRVALACYENIEHETPYDKIMNDIIDNVKSMMLKKKDKAIDRAYIIGAERTNTSTFIHEVCHGLYFTDKKYKNQVDKITSAIPREYHETLTYNLLEMGYTESVIDDEIQAYLSTNWKFSRFSKNVPVEVLFKYHEKYKKVLDKF
jgi:hypothetical protein